MAIPAVSSMSFDRLARHYRWLEAVLAGPLLQRCRLAWIDEIPPPRRVLLAGEGPGRFIEVAAARWPEAKFCYLDASQAMQREARRRCASLPHLLPRVTWRQGRLPASPLDEQACDLVVTHFFLDCFPLPDLEQVVQQLARAARPGAYWLLSDFHQATTGWRRYRTRVILASMYWCFRRLTGLPARTLTPPDPLLTSHSFRLRRRRFFSAGLLHTDLWEHDNRAVRGLRLDGSSPVA